MVVVSWKLTLATFIGVFIIMVYSIVTGRGNKKRNSIVKQLKIELTQLCNVHLGD